MSTGAEGDAPTAPECSIVQSGRTTCELGDLPVGTSRSLVFGGTVESGTPAGTELVDTATVVFDGVDFIEANNRDDDTVIVVARISAPTPTTTEPSQPASPGSGSSGGGAVAGRGGGGSIPATGIAVVSMLAIAAIAALSGAVLRVISRRSRERSLG